MLQEHVGSATAKLRQLAMEADNKDSGCDLDDLEESSGSGPAEADDVEKEEDNDDDDNDDDESPAKTLTIEDKIEQKYHEVKSKDDIDNHLAATPKKSVCRHTKSTGNIQRQRSRKTKDNRHSLKRLSVSSDASFKQFEELRDSIAKELNQVHNISSNLRDEIAQDLHSCRSRPMYFDIADSEREIAEIMKESYNLPDDDVESLASSTFTYDNPVFSRDQRGRHSGGSSRMSVYTTRSSRQSSFRSVASLSTEYGLGRHRDRPITKHSSLKMKWPLYIPPAARENQPREGEPPKIVTNAPKTKVSNKTSDSKVLYGTYV